MIGKLTFFLVNLILDCKNELSTFSVMIAKCQEFKKISVLIPLKITFYVMVGVIYDLLVPNITVQKLLSNTNKNTMMKCLSWDSSAVLLDTEKACEHSAAVVTSTKSFQVWPS